MCGPLCHEHNGHGSILCVSNLMDPQLRSNAACHIKLKKYISSVLCSLLFCLELKEKINAVMFNFTANE